MSADQQPITMQGALRRAAELRSKQLPETPAEFADHLRARAIGHAPGCDIAIYARPHLWLALADALDGKPKTKGARGHQT